MLVCKLLRPPHGLSDVAATSCSFGHQRRTSCGPTQVRTHSHCPIGSQEGRRTLWEGEVSQLDTLQDKAPSTLGGCVCGRGGCHGCTAGRYLRNLTGTEDLPRMHLVSEQHHVTARSSRAQLIHRLHHHLMARGQRSELLGALEVDMGVGGVLTDRESVCTTDTRTSFTLLFSSRA